MFLNKYILLKVYTLSRELLSEKQYDNIKL